VSIANPSEVNLRRSLPFVLVGIFLICMLFAFSLEAEWVRRLPLAWRIMYEIGLLLLIGLPVVWLVVYVRRLHAQQSVTTSRLKLLESLVGEAYQRLGAVLKIREQFSEAESDKEIIELLLRNTVDLTGAVGASFVPLDEHRHPLPSVSYGQPPIPMPADWLEYLASPSIRASCSGCEKHNRFVSTCPLLQGPFSHVAGLFCIPLRQGEREYGVLNIYVPDPAELDIETQAFISSLVDETAHALESVWLRRREMDTLAQLKVVRKQSDLNTLLPDLLQNVYHILEPDFALLVLRETASPQNTASGAKWLLREEIVLGNLANSARPFIQATIQQVLSTSEAVILGPNSRLTVPTDLRVLLALPLVADNITLGVLIVGNQRSQRFSPRQVRLLHSVASQIALVVHNANNLAEIEYKVMQAERTRLAREIHDGLAQSLGFLKLQAAQMEKYLDRGEIERLRQGIRLYHQTLSEAYQDARYAIDGLRITSSRLEDWLQQVLEEFQENLEGQTFTVNIDCTITNTNSQLPPEVQAQLIRIIQEALSNIRKHAKASWVEVSCKEKPEGLVLEIKDDGVGFLAEDVPGPSRHGLRGMRERSDLIRADFQIISLPNQGTTIRITLPKAVEEVGS
jgi:two-component system, NarL family, nitrate/nitrite sensor histidine kinase NarX